MPPKKRPPTDEVPEDTVTIVIPEELPTDERVRNTILHLQRIMDFVFDLDSTVTPEQLRDGAEMYLAMMHLKKVTPQYFLNHMGNAIALIRQAYRIEAEATLLALEGLDAKGTETLKGAVELSTKEINALRPKMLKDLQALAEIPLPGVATH